MQLREINSIIVPENRQRKAFDEAKLEELKQSILSKGLFHPIVVRYDQDMNIVLVVGERRLRAYRLIAKEKLQTRCDNEAVPLGFIPTIMMSDLDKYKIREAELEENIRRVDLTWQEHAEAVANLHALREQQKGVYDPSTKVGHTLADTAEELTGSRLNASQKVREQLIIAKHLSDPAVRKAASPKDALKLIKKSMQADLLAALAETSSVEDSRHKLYCIDAREGIATIDDNSIDCILTDPPYGIDADQFGSQSSTGHAYIDSKMEFSQLMNSIADETFRVCKPQAHLYMFCSIENFHYLSVLLTASGWDVWPRPLIWDKGNGMLSQPEHGPRYTYESILFANKGRKPVTGVYNDVIRIQHNNTKLLHGAQKPVAVYIDLLKRTCTPGDIILDPFCGSGTIFPAANKLQLTATAFEREQDTYNLALSRIQESGDVSEE